MHASQYIFLNFIRTQISFHIQLYNKLPFFRHRNSTTKFSLLISLLKTLHIYKHTSLHIVWFVVQDYFIFKQDCTHIIDKIKSFPFYIWNFFIRKMDTNHMTILNRCNILSLNAYYTMRLNVSNSFFIMLLYAYICDTGNGLWIAFLDKLCKICTCLTSLSCANNTAFIYLKGKVNWRKVMEWKKCYSAFAFFCSLVIQG